MTSIITGLLYLFWGKFWIYGAYLERETEYVLEF